MTRILAALVRPTTLYTFNPAVSTRAFASAPPDLYKTLGVGREATHAEIKSAFDEWTKAFKLEKALGDADAWKRYREIEGAYNVLSNYELRRLYNKGFQFNVAAKLDQTPADQQKALKTVGAQSISRTDSSTTSNRPFVVDPEFSAKTRHAIHLEDIKFRKESAVREARVEYEFNTGVATSLSIFGGILVVICGSYIYFEKLSD